MPGSVLGYDDHVVFSYAACREGFVTVLASRLGGFLFGSIFAGKWGKVELHSQLCFGCANMCDVYDESL